MTAAGAEGERMDREHERRRGVVKPTPPELMIDTGTGLDFETRLDRLPGYLTPVDRFFLRGHAPTPRLDAASEAGASRTPCRGTTSATATTPSSPTR
jgi:hypothetical protein